MRTADYRFTTVDFQKAQCFFMLAIQIAAQVVVKRGGFQPNNLQQLYNTFILIQSVCISGYLPITFTLFTLLVGGNSSWFLFILSAITVAVSAVTLSNNQDFSPNKEDLQYLGMLTGPSSCGNKDPTIYCLSQLTNERYQQFYGAPADMVTGTALQPDGVFQACLAILIFLFLYHLLRSEYRPVRDGRQMLAASPLITRIRFGYRKILCRQPILRLFDLLIIRNFLGIAYVVILLTYWVCFMMSFTLLRQFNNPPFHMIDVSNWEFGQIVSITV